MTPDQSVDDGRRARQPTSDPKTWPVRRAESFGGVVFRDSADGPEIALIKPSRSDPRRKKEVWALPKGGADADELPELAAVREVLEETGLEAEILGPVDNITYWFVWAPEQVRYRKTVHYFLMRAVGGDSSRHDDEVEEVRFFPLSEAIRRATYPTERKVLRRAAELVEAPESR